MKTEGPEKALPLWTLVFLGEARGKTPTPPRATINPFDAACSPPDLEKTGEMECRGQYQLPCARQGDS